MSTETKRGRARERVDGCIYFETTVIGLLDQLFGAALRLAKNREDAEDLVAETVTKAWASRHTLKDQDKFRAWIFRILTNTFMSDRRKRAVRPQAAAVEPNLSDEEEAFSLFEQLHQPFLLWWGNPEKQFLNTLLAKDLESAVDALPESFRMAVILSDMEGFSYQEISHMLKVPVGTVRSRLARGRGLLQKALWEHAKDAGLIHGQ
ncbi:MAG: sigma-70 family RNA polymerase sigma factor [Nitrospira sp.]